LNRIHALPKVSAVLIVQPLTILIPTTPIHYVAHHHSCGDLDVSSCLVALQENFLLIGSEHGHEPWLQLEKALKEVLVAI
jgi:hypothetical protein